MKLSKHSYLYKFALAYQGNIGFEEMFLFYKNAPNHLSLLMDFLLENNKTQEALELLEKTLNTKLEPL